MKRLLPSIVAGGVLATGVVAIGLVVSHRAPTTWHLDTPASTVTLDPGHYTINSTVAGCSSTAVQLKTVGQSAPAGSPPTDPMTGWASYGVVVYGGGGAPAHPTATHTSLNVLGRAQFGLHWSGGTPSGCTIDVTISRS